MGDSINGSREGTDFIETARGLVEGIKKDSLSQVDLWRQIPLLDLETSSESGFFGGPGSNYETGFLKLDHYGRYIVAIDLETGRLIDPSSAFEDHAFCGNPPYLFRDASDSNILTIAVSHPEKFNAIYHLEALEKSSGIDSHIHGHFAKEEFFRRTMERLGLENPYVRKPHEHIIGCC